MIFTEEKLKNQQGQESGCSRNLGSWNQQSIFKMPLLNLKISRHFVCIKSTERVHLIALPLSMLADSPTKTVIPGRGVSLPNKFRKLLLDDKNAWWWGSRGGVWMVEGWMKVYSRPPSDLLMEGVFILVMYFQVLIWQQWLISYIKKSLFLCALT